MQNESLALNDNKGKANPQRRYPHRAGGLRKRVYLGQEPLGASNPRGVWSQRKVATRGWLDRVVGVF